MYCIINHSFNSLEKLVSRMLCVKNLSLNRLRKISNQSVVH